MTLDCSNRLLRSCLGNTASSFCCILNAPQNVSFPYSLLLLWDPKIVNDAFAQGPGLASRQLSGLSSRQGCNFFVCAQVQEAISHCSPHIAFPSHIGTASHACHSLTFSRRPSHSFTVELFLCAAFPLSPFLRVSHMHTAIIHGYFGEHATLSLVCNFRMTFSQNDRLSSVSTPFSALVQSTLCIFPLPPLSSAPPSICHHSHAHCGLLQCCSCIVLIVFYRELLQWHTLLT